MAGSKQRQPKDRVNFATYPQDYFTGAQVRIYLGSIWVDDIATISYTTSHSKTPLYGYNDHQFRTVAKGQFLVRGSFTIAFKEVGYLYQIIQMWKKDKTISNTRQTKPGATSFLNILQSGTTIEDAMDQVNGQGNRPGQDFEDAAEVMQDAIWGKTGADAVAGNQNPNRIPRSDELDYSCYLSNDAVSQDIDMEGFDILITFGDYRSGDSSAETTIVSINNIHITGESMIVSPTAEPVGLSCEFFARGLNERVSNSWPEGAKAAATQAAQDKKDTATKTAQAAAQKQDPSPVPQQPLNPDGGSTISTSGFGTANDQAKFNTDVENLDTDFARMEGKLLTLEHTINTLHPEAGMDQVFASCFYKVPGGDTPQTNICLTKLYNYMQNLSNWNMDVYNFVSYIMYSKPNNLSAIQDSNLSSIASGWRFYGATLESLIDKAVKAN